MRHTIWITLLFAVLLTGCPKGKYDDLADAPESDKVSGEKLWNDYMQALGDRNANKNPVVVARFFSQPLMAGTTEEEFKKYISKCLKIRSAGAFKGVDVEALKNGPDSLLLVVDSKAGHAAIPVVKDGDQILFSELAASTGNWAAEAKPGPSSMPEEPSLLYIKMMLQNKQAKVGDRLRAAMMLAKGKYRKQIIAHQRTISDPIVRLGLGLARIKIDGSDESFVKNFPTSPGGIAALAQADKKIFDEMIVKLANLGAMQEDPPANEVLFKVAASAPTQMREQMGKALYTMAELGPHRLANAVRNLSKDLDKDPVLEIYVEEVKRRGKAPKVLRFLNKFSRIGEAEERKLCKNLLARIKKGL
ncbi:hypothetical protein ACFL2F_02975 [Myxococcota bacterium]